MHSAGCADHTRAMTEWPKYREIEQQNGVGGWSKAAELTPESLNRLGKVQRAAERAANNISNGKLFDKSEYLVKVHKIHKYVAGQKANEVIEAYSAATNPLEMEIVGLAEVLVKKLKSVTAHTDRVLSEEQEKDFREKIESLSGRLTKFKTDVQEDLAVHTQEPHSLANDRRTQEQYIRQLSMACRANVRAYTELLKAWEEGNYIKKDVSLEDCFRWDGKCKALKHLDLRAAWLAQALHKVASAVDALQANIGKTDFFAVVEEPKENNDDPEFARLAAKLALLSSLGALRGASSVEIRTVRVPPNSDKSDEKPSNCNQQ